MFDLMGRDI